MTRAAVVVMAAAAWLSLSARPALPSQSLPRNELTLGWLAAADANGFESGDALPPLVIEPEAPPATETRSPKPEPPAPAPKAEASNAVVDETAHTVSMDTESPLPSPTESPEAYEKERLDRLYRAGIPHWSVNFTVEPVSFRFAEFRTPANPQAGGTGNPSLTGILLGFERMILRGPGVVSAGMEGGLYTSTASGDFSGLSTGILSGGPYAQFEGLFFANQIAAPLAHLEYEFVRYNYKYVGSPVFGVKSFPRMDLGLVIYLNPLEPSSAASMKTGYGVKRTYLVATYTYANDSSKKKDFDLSDRTYRVGFRFEF